MNYYAHPSIKLVTRHELSQILRIHLGNLGKFYICALPVFSCAIPYYYTTIAKTKEIKLTFPNMKNA